MSSPYLTIIIPTLQAGRTLQASLESVLSQRFVDFEILIMDSVSRDDTLAIAGRYAGQDSRIRIISEPDKGVYDAMNKGIGLARGEWILFLGSDDELLDPGVLSSFAADPVVASFDMVYGNVISSSYKGVYDGVFDLKKLLKRNIPHQAIFYRTRLFGRIGLYTIRYKGYADWELNIRCFKDSHIRIHYVDRVIARFGADGISSRHDVPFLREVMIPERLQWLRQQGIKELRQLSVFDQWWRLLRNAGIGDFPTLKDYTGEVSLPRAISRMVAWQHWIPAGWLRSGIISKPVMFLNYIYSLLTGLS